MWAFCCANLENVDGAIEWLRLSWAEVQFLEVDFGTDEDLPVELLPRRTEDLLQKGQNGVLGRLLLLILVEHALRSRVFQGLVVFTDKCHKIGADIDQFLQLRLVSSLVSGQFEGLQ